MRIHVVISANTHNTFTVSRLLMMGCPGVQSGSVKGPALDMILSKYFLESVRQEELLLGRETVPF